MYEPDDESIVWIGESDGVFFWTDEHGKRVNGLVFATLIDAIKAAHEDDHTCELTPAQSVIWSAYVMQQAIEDEAWHATHPPEQDYHDL